MNKNSKFVGNFNMIQLIKRKRNIHHAVPVQNLVFEQEKYNEKGFSDKQCILVNKLYHIQHWHYFNDTELNFDEKIAYVNNLFGLYSFKKQLPEKGLTYIWFANINGNKYAIYQCSYACFLEVEKTAEYDQVLIDINELINLMIPGYSSKINSR
jgi:hypothetical protein